MISSLKISQIQPAVIGQQLRIIGSGFKSDTNYILKVLSPITNSVIETVSSSLYENENELQFSLETTNSLSSNTFYKAQIEASGKKSNIGVFKYLGSFVTPTVEIEDNFNIVITQEDSNEFLKTVQIIYKIGEQEIISLKDILVNQETYTYDCPYAFFTTSNGKQITVKVQFTTQNNYSGVVTKVKNIPVETSVIKSYLLDLANNELASIQDYGGWCPIKNNYYFKYKKYMTTDDGVKIFYRYPDNISIDNSAIHGVSSDYILENNNSLYQANNINNYFTDMFLIDKENNYRIQFNPKVSAFKEVRLEEKVETIGSQYPFISRNGTIGYKEFEIGGLISYLAQPLASVQIGRASTVSNEPVDTFKDFSTNLTDENIYNEREFRLVFLAWLNNGQPKIFKSPTEGNYIVRLMNVSLTPEEKLGRMLYSFSAIAVEVAEYSFENLKKYNLL